jgi:predicted nucleic acid-binding protein
MTEQSLFGVDTNILFYAAGYDDPAKRDKASMTLARIGSEHLLAPTQVLGEFYAVLVRKAGLSRGVAADTTRAIAGSMRVHAAGPTVFTDALDLASAHQLQFWDALILATAADAGARVLLTEDMADGFVWRGCTVANPFAETLHPLLADALRG